jgi:ABC-type multidrug transport system fused ATPase/permease subunit
MCIWVYTGEINSKRIRERYLKAVLRQDIAFFDDVGAGEVATRIQTDTRELALILNACLFHSIFRFGAARHFRESATKPRLYCGILHRFHSGVYPMLATCSRYVFNPTLHCYHWRHHEQICLSVHAVSILPISEAIAYT